MHHLVVGRSQDRLVHLEQHYKQLLGLETNHLKFNIGYHFISKLVQDFHLVGEGACLLLHFSEGGQGFSVVVSCQIVISVSVLVINAKRSP